MPSCCCQSCAQAKDVHGRKHVHKTMCTCKGLKRARVQGELATSCNTALHFIGESLISESQNYFFMCSLFPLTQISTISRSLYVFLFSIINSYIEANTFDVLSSRPDTKRMNNLGLSFKCWQYMFSGFFIA